VGYCQKRHLGRTGLKQRRVAWCTIYSLVIHLVGSEYGLYAAYHIAYYIAYYIAHYNAYIN